MKNVAFSALIILFVSVACVSSGPKVPSESEMKLIAKTTLVQDFARNYISVPAFHSRGWKDGEKVKINEQYFTIHRTRVSGEDSTA